MALVEFYIKNYRASDGSIVTAETLFQTVPMASGHPAITNPKVKTELGKAGSLEFGLEMNSPYYDAMLQMKTIIRVVYFGETLFRGRVLTIDRNLTRTRTIHCEGDLTFLLDSHQNGVKDELRKETTVNPYLTSLITQHNADVDDPDKCFTLGEIPGQYTSTTLADQQVDIPADKAKQKFGSSSYDSTMNRIEDLLGDFGGYWRTRYDDNTGTVYLDWLDNYYNPYMGQKIQVASNLIDLSGPTEVENLFTIVIPIGRNNKNKELFINDWWPQVSPGHAKVNYITVPELASVPLYSDTELNAGYHRKADYENAITKFGKIWKVVDFENANTPEKLFTYCKDWMKNNYLPELTQWNVSALDMKFVDGQNKALFTGDRVQLVHPEVDQTTVSLTVISADYDLYNPKKNSFKIGIPNQQINASYGVKQKQSGGGGGSTNTELSTTAQPETGSKPAHTEAERVHDIMQQQYFLKTKYGEDIYLDDPLAFLAYEEDGLTERSPEQVAQDTSDAIRQMELARHLYADEIMIECGRRGLPPDDLQVLIEFTPGLEEKQRRWRAGVGVNLVESGLTLQEADLLLNESEGSSWLCALVDDQGNWTQAAYERGCLMWNDAEHIRQMAINARALHQGSRQSQATPVISTALGWFTGGNMSLGGYLNFDGQNQTFDLGDLFHTEDGTNPLTGASEQVVTFFNELGTLFNNESEDGSGKPIWERGLEFFGGLLTGSSNGTTDENGKPVWENALELISGLLTFDQETSQTPEGRTRIQQTFDFLDGLFTGSDSGIQDAYNRLKTFFLGNDKAEIDGENGTAGFGADQTDGWKVKLNDTITYTDEEGVSRTASGFVSAKDFHIKEVPSFKTKLAVIDTAVVGLLEADEAIIERLTAAEAYIDKINASTVTADTYVAAEHMYATYLSASGSITSKKYYLQVAGPSGTTESASLALCFSSAVGSFDDGTYKLTLYRIGGGDAQEVNFNVAATTWYQEKIAAATSSGYSSCASTVYAYCASGYSIRPGGSRTVYARYRTESGSDVNADSITISAYRISSVAWEQNSDTQVNVILSDGSVLGPFTVH